MISSGCFRSIANIIAILISGTELSPEDLVASVEALVEIVADTFFLRVLKLLKFEKSEVLKRFES